MPNKKEPFEPELSKTFKAYNYHWKKLSVASNPNIRFLSKPPYDFYVVNGGKFYAIEAKCCRARITSFENKRVEEHQINGLLDASKRTNAEGYLFINFRKPDNRAYAVEINDYLSVLSELGSRKSIPRALFDTDERFKLIDRKNIDGVVVWVVEDILGVSECPKKLQEL